MAQMCMFVRMAGDGAGTSGLVFVDWRFLRSWSMWPRCEVMLFGRCLVTSFLFNPGKDAKKPVSIAFKKVDFTGNPRDAWWN